MAWEWLTQLPSPAPSMVPTSGPASKRFGYSVGTPPNPFTPATPNFTPNAALAAMASVPTIPVLSTQSSEAPMPIPGDPLSYLPQREPASMSQPTPKAPLPQEAANPFVTTTAAPAADGVMTTMAAPAAAPAAAPNARGRGAMGDRPDFSGYIGEGFARHLARMLSNPELMTRLLGDGFAQRLDRFGLTPEMIQAEGFDPLALYTRQDARQDWRAGNEVLAPGSMVPAPAVAPAPAPAAAAVADPVAAAQASGLGSNVAPAPAAQPAAAAQGQRVAPAVEPQLPPAVVAMRNRLPAQATQGLRDVWAINAGNNNPFPGF